MYQILPPYRIIVVYEESAHGGVNIISLVMSYVFIVSLFGDINVNLFFSTNLAKL